ncbi:MAG TPA: lytic murein transglycosylase B [Candidatus Desulfobacillus sp.]|nr:lytic murein transglycosylase B [Candidatus Desulfobacillus sp.]
MTRCLPCLFLCLLALLLPAQARAEGFSGREAVQAFIEEMHEKHDFDRQRLARLFRQLQPQTKVLRLIAPPATPLARSWRAYRGRFLDSWRIGGGLRFWRDNARELESARRIFGVPEEIIVAIIGIETLYGRNTGKFPALAALATLAFDYPPRAALFRRELEALLLLSRETGRDPLSYTGSYAGALGMPQFLPSSIRRWGMDFDGDGRTDLAGSPSDAIGSVANFLVAHGWQEGGPIAVPVRAGGERLGEIANGDVLPRLTPAEMAAYGVVAAADAPQQPCALIDLATPGETTEYWLGYQNFYVITRYNRSSFYAMAVHALAAELRAAWQARPLAGQALRQHVVLAEATALEDAP